jgi:hypothetical protein
MKIDWNVDQVIGQCQKMYNGATDQYVTGWNNWPCKQDLYRVKFAVDEMLNNIGKFTGEETWLEEQAKAQTWKILKKE